MMNIKSLLLENQEKVASERERDLFPSCPISTLPTLPQGPALGEGEEEFASYWI
jgi:hypothetical protein